MAVPLHKVRNTGWGTDFNGIKTLLILGCIEIAVVVEYSRQHEQEVLKFVCLKFKRAAPAAIVTWDTSEYDSVMLGAMYEWGGEAEADTSETRGWEHKQMTTICSNHVDNGKGSLPEKAIPKAQMKLATMCNHSSLCSVIFLSAAVVVRVGMGR